MDRYATYALDALPVPYQGRVLNSADLAITRELADPLWNATPDQRLTLELDNQDAALTGSYIAGLRSRVLAVKRYDVKSGFLATKFTGLVHWPRLTDQRVILECGVLDRALLTQPVPAPVVTTTIFPNAVDVGATIPAGFGHVVTSPCPNVNDDKILSRFDYLIGHGTWAVTALARNGLNDALYSIQFGECVRAAGGAATSWAEVARTDLYPGYTVVRFSLRQQDFNNGLHKIYVTGTGPAAERNFAHALATLLSHPVWGLRQSVNAASLAEAAAVLDALPVPLYCDGMMLAPKPAQDWLSDLLMVRGLWLDRNAAGEITLHVDQMRTTVAMAIGHDPGDGPRNLVSIRERSGPAPEEYIRQVVVQYRLDYVRNVYVGQAQRTVNTEGKTREIPHAFLRDATSADLVADYLGKRLALEQEPVEVTVTQEGRALDRGDLVSLTKVRMGYYGHLLRVWKITEQLTTLTLVLRPWSWTIFTYTAGPMPTDPVAGTELDFSHTDPSAATGLSVSSSGTTIDGQGTVSAWVILAFTNPTTNFATADVLWRLTGATEYAFGAKNITAGATTARVEGLPPNTPVDYAVRVVNAFARTSALTTLTTQTTPTDASVPSALYAILVHQSGAKVVEILCGFTAPADWAFIRVYRATSNSFAAASLLTYGKKAEFHDENVSYGTTYYYWAKVEDTSGNLSGVSPSSGHSVTVVEIDTPDIKPTAVTDASFQVLAAVGQVRNATQALVTLAGLSVARNFVGANQAMVQFSGVWQLSNNSAITIGNGIGVNLVRDGGTIISGASYGTAQPPAGTAGAVGEVTIVIPVVDAPGAGTHTYTVTWIVQSTNVATTVFATCQKVFLEVVELKR